MPTRMIATISSEVPTGRSMKIRDGFMSRPELLVGLGGSTRAAAAALAVCALRAFPLRATSLRARWPAALAGRGTVGRRRRTAVRWCRGNRPAGVARRAARAADLGAVAQAVGAVDHHVVADRQAFDHGDLLAVSGAGLDDSDLDSIVRPHAVDEGAGLSALDGGDRHDDGILHRVGQQADVDELVGEQRLVGIVEDGAQLHRAGGGVDLVVVGRYLAGAELGLLRTI